MATVAPSKPGKNKPKSEAAIVRIIQNAKGELGIVALSKLARCSKRRLKRIAHAHDGLPLIPRRIEGEVRGRCEQLLRAAWSIQDVADELNVSLPGVTAQSKRLGICVGDSSIIRTERKPYRRYVNVPTLAHDAKVSLSAVRSWIRNKHCPVLGRRITVGGLTVAPKDANDIVEKFAELRRDDLKDWPTDHDLAQECEVTAVMIRKHCRPGDAGGVACPRLSNDKRTAMRFLPDAKRQDLPSFLVNPKLADSIRDHYRVDQVLEGVVRLAKVPIGFKPLTYRFAAANLDVVTYRLRIGGCMRDVPHVSIEAARKLQTEQKRGARRDANGDALSNGSATGIHRVKKEPLRLIHDAETYIYIPHAEAIYETNIRTWLDQGTCTWLLKDKASDLFRRLRVPDEQRRRYHTLAIVWCVRESYLTEALAKRDAARETPTRAANRVEIGDAPLTIPESAAYVGVPKETARTRVFAGAWEGVAITNVREPRRDSRGRMVRQRLVNPDELQEVKCRRDKRLSHNPFPAFVERDGKRYFRSDIAAKTLGISVSVLESRRRQGRVAAIESGLRGSGKSRDRGIGSGLVKWYYLLEEAQPAAAAHSAPNGDAAKQPPATTSGTSATPDHPTPSDQTWWGASHYAVHFTCPRSTADNRLRAFRKAKPDRGGADWTENPDHGARQPAHLYRFGAVKHLFA